MQADTMEQTGVLSRQSLPEPAFSEPSTGIILAVSEVLGVEPVDLPPLSDAVDADALDRMLARGNPELSISLEYANLQLEISGTQLTILSAQGC